MEFITGLKQQEEAELEDLLKAEEGTTIILEGAVQHQCQQQVGHLFDDERRHALFEQRLPGDHVVQQCTGVGAGLVP